MSRYKAGVMRDKFTIQSNLDILPIEKIIIPIASRDQLAPILRGLQQIHSDPEVMDQIYTILEAEIQPSISKEKGRPGLTLWQILVLGIIRHARSCDYDALEDFAYHHNLVRQFLNLPAIHGSDLTNTPYLTYKTIRNNVALLTEEILQKINKIIAQYGHKILSKNSSTPDRFVAKCDTYVLETNVHFPTDYNLLFDAARKTIQLIFFLSEIYPLKGWRKHKSIISKIKGKMRSLSNINKKGGQNKKERRKKVAREYLDLAIDLYNKASDTINELNSLIISNLESDTLAELHYFHEMLKKHIDLVERRLIKGEIIPHDEKMFSLFETHTQWIAKGKAGKPVELGRKLLITSDQNQIIIDYKILKTSAEHAEADATVERIFQQYGNDSIESISFDKGFSSAANKTTIKDKVEQLIMPKKGKLTQEEAAEEHEASYIKLRHAHSAIESNINSLEYHGLDRCLDKGEPGFGRCVGLGILAYNLHQIGKGLKRKEKEAQEKSAKRQRRKTSRAAA